MSDTHVSNTHISHTGDKEPFGDHPPNPIGQGGRAMRPFAVHYIIFGVAWTVFFVYTSVWLTFKGISPALVGSLFLVGSLSRIILTPIFSEISDRLGQRWWVIMGAYSIMIPIGLVMMYGDFSEWVLFVLVIGYTGFLGVTFSTLESYALLSSKTLGFNYPTVRGCLSFSVALGCVGLGMVFEFYGMDLFPVLVTVLFVVLWLSMWWLPRVKSEKSTEKLSLLKPLQIEGVGIAIILSALVFTSFAPFMVLGNLFFVETRGFSESQFGWIMGVAVMAEALFFFYAGKRVQKWRVFWMMAIASGTGIIRFLGYEYGDGLVTMMIFHSMHAFSFGLVHTMIMELFRRVVPPQYTSSATGLYDIVANIGFGIGAGIGGYIFQMYGIEQMINFCIAVTVVGMVIGTITAIKRSSSS